MPLTFTPSRPSSNPSASPSYWTQCVTALKSRLTLTNAVTTACLAAYALTIVTGEALIRQGALQLSKVFAGQIWRIGTSPILHGNILHLTLNMYGLCQLGPRTESRWGSRAFAEIAVLSITANLLTRTAFRIESAAVGLSGVLYGMVGAHHVIRTREGKPRLDLRSSVKFLALNGFLAMAVERGTTTGIDHVGHLSGYVAGLAFGTLSNKGA